MPIPSIAALNTGSDEHLLDHIAPMAALLQIPLIVSEERNFHLAKDYYPHINVECWEDLEFRIGELADRFDALIECKYWLPHLKTMFSRLHGKKMDLIFCPHGQSDKGFASPLLSPYAQQDIVLLYGDLQIQMLERLKIWPAIDRFAIVGDYRRSHYRKHKAFYDAIADREIFSRLSPHLPTLLYAPTWQDADRSTSFFDWEESLCSQLPADWNLIVKVHPLLEQRDPARYYAALRHFDKLPNALLIAQFPPVHPILERVDAYLGDFSSVGYDFLGSKRPMFFFFHPALSSGPLRSCGTLLDAKTPIFPFIGKHLHLDFSKDQERLYRSAFGVDQKAEKIREAIYATIGQML